MSTAVERSILLGAVVGLVSGAAAAAAMEAVQTALSKARQQASGRDGGEQDQPATEKAADRVSQAVRGRPVEDTHKAPAGRAVHYATGAALGLAYGAAAEVWPSVTAGFGAVFAGGLTLGLDEGLVPLLGLSKPARETPPADHLYSLTSHLAYGIVLEGVRRALRRLGTARLS